MRNTKLCLRVAACLFVGVLLAGGGVQGHAILKETSPAANSSISGPDVPIKLKFNVRVDATRSKLQLLHPDNLVTDIIIEGQPAPDTLSAKVRGLRPGAYAIRWQVLAPDGHITRGEIPFKISGL